MRRVAPGLILLAVAGFAAPLPPAFGSALDPPLPPPDVSGRVFARHFSPHLPIYFLLGPDKPVAKFQFSFKYLLWGSDGMPALPAQPERGVYFGYTQRSLWDITGNSSPFYDTSYMPELIYGYRPPPDPSPGWQWRGFQAAAQHESNGEAGPASRSLNLLYVKPTVAYVTRTGWQFILTPKLFVYIGGLSDNPDLPRYRGYGEYGLTVLKDALSLSLMARIGSLGNRGSFEADFSFPLRTSSGGFATFVMMQYFDGYGESLLSYENKSHTVRLGVALVR